MLIAGYSQSGHIDDNNFLWTYCFYGLAGSEYRISAETTEDDLDPKILVITADFQLILAENDNATNRTTDAQIDFVPDEDGVYLIFITRGGGDNGQTTGDYVVSLENRTTHKPDGCTDALSFPAQGIEIGQMDKVFMYVYCFNGKEDEQVTFTAHARSGNLDMAIFITAPNLDTIKQVEGKLASMELTATIPQDGPYIITVIDLTGAVNFAMTFDNANDDCESPPLSILIAGEWTLPPGGKTTTMTFECGGRVSGILYGNAFEATYTLKNDILTLSSEDGDMVINIIRLTHNVLSGTTRGQAFMLLNITP